MRRAKKSEVRQVERGSYALIVVERSKIANPTRICENGPLRFTTFIVLLSVPVAYGQFPAPLSLYRLDDQFKSPDAAAPIVEIAAPIVWQNFLSEDDITWGVLRGRMGYRKGDLIVKGDGSTPVIVSPNSQPIDWNLYE